MRAIKFLIISCLISMSLISPAASAYNKCGKVASSQTAPTSYDECTSEDPDGATCCYVKVRAPVQNTMSTTTEFSYCALIPGAYVREESKEEFKKNLPTGFTAEVNCYGTLYSFSVLFLVALFSLLL